MSSLLTETCTAVPDKIIKSPILLYLLLEIILPIGFMNSCNIVHDTDLGVFCASNLTFIFETIWQVFCTNAGGPLSRISLLYDLWLAIVRLRSIDPNAPVMLGWDSLAVNGASKI